MPMESTIFSHPTGGTLLLASYYEGHTLAQAVQFMGLIPHWIVGKRAGETMRECCKRNYDFGWHPMTGHTINVDYSLSYPEDPDLPPIAALVFEDERMVAYEHAIFMFTQAGVEPVIVRMD